MHPTETQSVPGIETRPTGPSANLSPVGSGSPSPFRYAARAAGLRASAIRDMLKVTAQPEVISFAGGLPCPELFPLAEFRRAARAVLSRTGPSSLQYDLSEGHPPLREWVCRHLGQTVGLAVSPDQVLITSGAQQALDLIGKVLIDPGDVVLVENPAYLGALQAFGAYEPRVCGLPTDDDGILVEALHEVLRTSDRRPKFLYVVSNFQNPTGHSTSLERRLRIVALTTEYGIPIVEDDPYGRLRYAGPDLPAMASLPGAEDCLYLGTCSKILAPGMRVAWLCVRDLRLHERLLAAKQACDLHTSSFTQRLVWQIVRQSGFMEAHLSRLRRAYTRRRDAMLSALDSRLPPGSEWTRPAGGLFLWVKLPEPVDTLELLKSCVARKVAFVPGAPFWVGAARSSTLRLNFSNASEDRIAVGINRLGEAVSDLLDGPPLPA